MEEREREREDDIIMTSIFKGNFSERKSEAIGTAQNKTVKYNFPQKKLSTNTSENAVNIFN